MDNEQERAPGDERPAAATAGALDPEEIQKQRDEFYDLLLRKTAEFDNYRKRIERERQAFAESAAADLIEELLPIIDNLERALAPEAATPAASSYREGVELIHRQLLEILRKRGVRPIDAVGHQFDPNYHEAVLYEPAEGAREGVVLEELRRGYVLGDRLLRAAMVKVARGKEQDQA